jgi:lipid-binding SYLF domain-containing protein
LVGATGLDSSPLRFFCLGDRIMKAPNAVCGVFAMLGSLMLTTGCSTVPQKESDRERLSANVNAVYKGMNADDSTLRPVIQNSAGYAVFPDVGKGGFIAGAAYGHGQVFDSNGKFLGYSDIKQGTVGAQAGAQAFDEMIIFKDRAALDKFMSGQFALSANYSAVVLKAQKADSANFNDGVLVLVRPEGGAMIEASIGGQKFDFVPASQRATTTDHNIEETQ